MPSFPGRPPVLLELDLTRPLVEHEPDDPLGKLTARGRPRLRAVLRALHEAGADPHVGGLVARLGGRLPLAVAQELRDGVQAFAASGKPTVGWAETLGDVDNGTVGYYLASGFGELWLQPSGGVGLLGVAAETTFLRGALDKLGIDPQVRQRYEYKSAADRIVRQEYTPAHREALERLVESAWEDVVAAVAAGRGLPADAVQAAADAGPLTAAEALASGLVDRLGYRDEVYAELRRRLGGEVRLLFAGQWSPRRRPVHAVADRRRPVVAVVDGVGAIVPGRSAAAPSGRRMGSDTVAAAFRAARSDDRVRAVVFRVDSPGGSAVASDTIWREVRLTREAGTPVVVSMGSLAGSGGYYVACPADVVVAQPGTLTGSIGVLGGKAVVDGLLARVGLTTGAVSRGARARMFSARRPFDDGELARLDRLLDTVYDDFVARVAEGRRMTREQVHEVARGRVWSGRDAAARGLVDELGGLRDAVRIARSRAGLRPDAPVRPALHVPLMARFGTPRNSEDPRAAGLSSWTLGWGSAASVAAAVGLPAAGPLVMPDVRFA